MNEMTPPSGAADVIEIEGLDLRTVIGIFDFERDRRQDVSISLQIETDIRPAAQSDAIGDALDYKRVTKRVIELVEASSFFLIETLVERVATCVLEEPRASRVTVRIDKPGALRYARTVGIRITRSREENP